MRRIASIAMLLLVFSIFTGSSTRVHAEEQGRTSQNVTKVLQYKVVKVVPGDSLSKIAQKHHSTYKRIFFANKKVKNPNLIFPGEKLRIPNKDMKLKKRPMPGSVSVSTWHQSYVRTEAAPKVTANYASGTTVWDRLAACESGGNWAINTGNGYYGGLQFTLSSWRGVGGSGYPNQATREEQIKRGQMLQASSGWGAWPACAAKLSLL